MDEIEVFASPMWSLPIRVPGQALTVRSNMPSFQVSLKGAGDEQHSVFEANQMEHQWTSNSVHYSLGRCAWDILFDQDVSKMEDNITLDVQYSCLLVNQNSIPTLSIHTWSFSFCPSKWVRLHHLPFKHVIRQITVVNSTVPFRLAVAGVPIRVCQRVSENGTLLVSNLSEHDKSGIIFDNALDRRVVLGVWLVFDENPFLNTPNLQIQLI